MSTNTGTIGGQQGQQFTQFGDIKTARQEAQAYREGHRGFTPLFETFAQIDNSDINNATIARDSGETKITMPSGSNAGETAKLQSRRNLNYVAGEEAFYSGYVREGPDINTDQQLIWGPLTSNGAPGDGLGFKRTSSSIEPFIRKNGTDRLLKNIDPSARYEDRSGLSVDLLKDGRIWFVKYAFYGAGPRVTWGVLKKDKILPKAQDIEEIFYVYDPAQDPDLSDGSATPVEDGTYIRTPNLPFRTAIDNNGTSPTTDYDVYVGNQQIGLFGDPVIQQRNLWETTGEISTGTGESPYIALKPKETFQGRPNDVNIIIDDIKIRNIGNNSFFFKCQVNGDITDGSATPFNDSQYAAEESSANVSTSQLSGTYGSGLEFQPADRVQAGNKSGGQAVERGIANFTLSPGSTFSVWIDGRGSSSEAGIIVNWRESF